MKLCSHASMNEYIYVWMTSSDMITTTKFKNFDSFSENIGPPILKAIVKYRKHPSIISIASEFIKKCFSPCLGWRGVKAHSLPVFPLQLLQTYKLALKTF